MAAPLLIVLGGLPGSGKTTVARLLAARLGALHLRIDSIEEAIRASVLAPEDVADAGYRAAFAVATDNLRLGRTVIGDSVNPLELSRAAWRDAAAQAGAACLEVELVCSDAAEHRRRVEARRADLPGQRLPDWAAVESRAYEPWQGERMLLDTAELSAEAAAERIAAARSLRHSRDGRDP